MRTAAAIKDERMHGRARILGVQWRRVRTCDSGSKRDELCVRADICADTDRTADEMRKCCSDCIGYCGNAAARFIHARQNISCKLARRFSVDYARTTLYRLKSSGYQKLARYMVNIISLPLGTWARRAREGWFIISTMLGVCISIILTSCAIYDSFQSRHRSHIRLHQTRNFFKKKNKQLIYYTSFMKARNKKLTEVTK